MRRITNISLGLLLKGFAACLLVAGLAWVALARFGVAPLTLQAVFAPLALSGVVGLLLMRIEFHWTRPARRLEDVLRQFRLRQATLEDLSDAGSGGVAPLAAALLEICQALRQQEATLQALDSEMHQRVARRTDALERQLGSLRQQATRDQLTGMFNRRMLDTQLPELLDAAKALEHELSVAVIDIDHFKTLNDTLGHAAGDQLLRDIGQIIRSAIRECDWAFRLGGDEFVIALPGCGALSAADRIQAIAATVDLLVKPLKLARLPKLSFGISTSAEKSIEGAAALIARADERLYLLKTTRKQAQSAA